MKREVKEKLFDIATATEGVSGRIKDIILLVSMMLVEQEETHSNKEKLEVLSNVIIDMLDYQSRDIQYLAEKIYDIYRGEREDIKP